MNDRACVSVISVSRRVSRFPALLMLIASCGVLAGTSQAQTPVAQFSGAMSTLAPALNSPNGVAVDNSGNVFFTSQSDNAVYELVAVNGVIPAGSTPIQIGAANGNFNAPDGVAVDANGNVFVADTVNNSVKEILASGGYTTVNQISSSFNAPQGLAVDAHGNVFVADSGNSSVKEIVATSGAVSSSSTVIQISSSSSFSFGQPVDVAVDATGNVFVADYNNSAVYEIVATSGAVSSSSTVNQIGSGFSGPNGVNVDGNGNVFVADYGNNAVKEIVAAGGYTTVNTIGNGFNQPTGVAVDGRGNVFVVDQGNSAVKEIMTQGVNFGAVRVATTTPPTLALIFTVGTTGALNSTTPYQVLTQGQTQDAQGNPLDFAAASSGNTCTGTVSAGTTCTVNVTFTPKRAGQRLGAVELLDISGSVIATAYVYGTGQGPQISYSLQGNNPGAVTTLGTLSNFTDPYGVAVDAAGNIFVADYSQNGTGAVLEMTAASSYATVKTLAQANGGFKNPTSVAVDGAGNVFVADVNNHEVKEILAVGGYETVKLLGPSPNPFTSPVDLAVDGSGNVFVVDDSKALVFEMTAANGYATANKLAQANGNFNSPEGLAVDGSGNVFVADSGNGLIKEIVAAGGYTTVNTLAEAYGAFGFPIGMGLDANGNIFVANDTGPKYVQKILAAGGYTTVIDLSQAFTSYLSSLPNAVTPAPVGLALDGNGNIFVTNFAASSPAPVVKMDYADPPPVAKLTFATPTNVGALDSAEPKTVMVQNIGNAPLIFAASSPSYPANFPENSGDPNVCHVASTALSGASCDVSANFQPTGGGSNSGSVVLTDNALNSVDSSGVGSAVQNIALSGTGVQSGDTTSVGITVSSGSLVYGQTETLTATVTDITTSSSIPTGTVTFTDSVGGTATTLGTEPLTNGVATYPAYTPTAGTHTITASYAPAASSNFASSSNTTGASFTVAAYGTLASFQVAVATSPVYAGVADTVTVTALDQYGNTIANYTGAVSLTSTDLAAAFGPVTFTSGVGTATVTFTTPGSQTVTATSVAITGTSAAVTVNAPPKYVVTVNTDTTTGTATNCTDQNRSGATLDTSCSLRDAIAAANLLPAGVNVGITFDPTAFATAKTITLANGTLTLNNNMTITGATSGSGVSLTNLVTVDGNHASGVFAVNSGMTTTLTDLIIANGQTPSADGGGIWNQGTLTVANSTLSGNSATNNGGGIYNTGVLTVTNSTLSTNAAGSTSLGGGIYNTGILTVANDTFYGNSASVGGGIYNLGPQTVAVTNSTFSVNSAPSGGAGIDSQGPLTVTNSIISVNLGLIDSQIAGTYTNNGGNFLNKSGDGLASLGNYGGPTQTMPPRIGSPALGAGTYQSGEPTTDQRGYARPSSGAIDSGAVQVSGNGATITTVSPNSGPVAGGNTVVIAGSGFSGATAVYFGANSVVPTTISNDGTSITVTAPAGTGTVDVMVVTPAGITATTSADKYTYAAVTATQEIASTVLTQNHAATSFTPVLGAGAETLSYSVTPILPNGLNMSGTNGAITGTPTAASPLTTYTVTVTDTSTNVTATATFSLTVNAAVTATQAIPSLVLTYNVAASSSVPVKGGGGTGSLTYSIFPSLPSPLSFSTSGTVTGTPGAASPAANYTVTVTDANGASASNTFSLTVNKATPTITWGPLAPITYGTKLSATQFNANATSNGMPLGGTFQYDVALEQILPAGSHTLNVTFLPSDSTDYNSASGSVMLVVNQATATVTLGSLTATYDGSPRAATATTSPTGLTVNFTYNGSTVAPTNVGSYTVVGTINDTNYQGTATGTLAIGKGTATVTLGSLAATYDGNAHVATATTSPTGLTVGFTYNGSAAAPTNANSYTVVGTINDTNYQGTATGTLVIGKATPTIITPPTASPISYGQMLSDSTLGSGTVSFNSLPVPGAFAWTPGSTKPAAGTTGYPVTFTPTDTTNYTTATGTASVTVSKATSTITTLPIASSITYGQTLTSSTLSGGVASFGGTSVPGMFTWTTSSTKPTAAGTPSYSITFTPTDVTDYNTATGTVSVIVNPAAQTVTFTQPAPIAYGSTNTITLSATGGASDNPVTFTVVSGPGSISGKVLTISGAGTIVIDANQTGNTNYAAATQVQHSLVVSKASSTLTGPATQPVQVVNAQTGTIPITVAGQYSGAGITAPGNNISYTVSGNGFASGTAAVTNGVATIQVPSTVAPGPYTVVVSYAGDTNYAAATPINVSVQVGKIQPTINWPQPAAITYGASLANVLNATAASGANPVPGTFSYLNGATPITSATILTAGSHTLTVNFTPTDTTTYKTATGTVSLQVNQVTPTLNWSAPAAITYGTALGSGQLDATASVQGAFTYTPAAGAVLQAGSHTLSATFAPTDSTDYNTPTTPVTTTIEVGKATPTVTAWPTVSGLAYGATLASLKLNGGAATANGTTVGGTFTWSNPSTIPAIGTNGYSVTFTPADTTDYNTVAGTVSVSTDQVATTTGLQDSAGAVMLLSPVTFTATVATSSGSPTGTVSFVDGSSPLGSAPLVNGVASLTLSTLTAGSHTISAVYSGDGTYAVSTSSTVSETVIDLNTTQTVNGGSPSGSNPTVTVLPGAATNVTLDFTTTLNVTKLPVPAVLTVTGLPEGATVGVNPAVWSQTTGTSWTLPAATTLVNPNVAIQLPSLTATNAPQQGSLPGWQKTASASVLLSLLFLPFSRRMRSAGKRLRGGVMLAVLLMAGLAATVGLTGCGASNGFLGQQQQTYNVTMTVTAGTVTRTSNLTLTVQ